MPPREPSTATNPEQTRGRAAASQTSLRFPLSENPPMTTRLTFKTYQRFVPSATASESTTTLITLPLPLTIPDRSSLQTGNQDMWKWGLVNMEQLNRGMELWSTESITQLVGTGMSVISDQMTRMEEQWKSSALKGLALSPLAADIIGDRRNFELAAGVIQNPHTNLMFNGVNLKSHFLSWRVSPRSQQESDALQQIINIIKYRIHPAEAFGGFALDYPDTVEVEFTGDAAKYLPKIGKGMVTEFDVKLGGGGSIAMYKSGAPVDVEFTLTLSELNTITRNVLDQRGDGAVAG